MVSRSEKGRCTIQMEKKRTRRSCIPETVSPYAQEQAAAHRICIGKLQKMFADSRGADKIDKSGLQKLRQQNGCTPEMERAAEEYADYICGIVSAFPRQPFAAVGKRLDLDPWIAEGFAVADCIMICGKELHIVDFKYGRGIPVKAERNCRLALCALGAYREFGRRFVIADIYLHIVQPRMHNCAVWVVTTKDLLLWGESVMKTAADHGLTA